MRQKLLASLANVSGGTLESLMHSLSRDPNVLKETSQAWALSPVEGRETSSATNVFGLRHDRDIGLLSASSATATTNKLVVHRTWGLLRSTDKDYGPNFQYNEYDRATSPLSGISRVLSTGVLFGLLSFAPVRNIASRFLPNPGDGPDVEQTRNSRIAVEVVAVPDVTEEERAPRALATFSYPSGPYHATALFLAQGAASLLYAKKLAGGYAGGCLTPAILSDDFMQRIRPYSLRPLRLSTDWLECGQGAGKPVGTAKIKALADVRPIAIDNADSIIRSFHVSMNGPRENGVPESPLVA
ncbi:hypothetical protein DL764_003661 [Monosporascus ibericus]|uniref:Uncharacterized protein n=1 Tax=Monosporascus ibericus TaxID=155417 RepID=A0A4Q4THF8_9PEZI|nr:hypothetical protein DL764_003661 [Monosporascus ibericus]